MLDQVDRNTGTVVLDAELERQRHLVLRAGHRQAHAGAIGGGQHDLAVGLIADGLGGVLDEVQEHLHQLIAIGEDRRQRGVVFLDDADRTGEAGGRQTLHVVEDGVDVDRVALHRAFVGEDLHAVDQLHDTIRLVADQSGEGAIVVVGRLFEELSGAANAGERVLDLVSEHRREAGHRAGGAAMGELAVDLLRHGALLEHHHDVGGAVGHWGGVDVDDSVAGQAGALEIDAIFAHGSAALADLIEKLQQRRAEGDEIVDLLAPHEADAGLEEVLGGVVGGDDGAARVDGDDRMRQRIEHRSRLVADGEGRAKALGLHAALLSTAPE